MKHQRFTKDEFTDMLQEMMRRKAETQQMLGMEPSNTPTSKTRFNIKRFMKFLRNADEVDIRFR